LQDNAFFFNWVWQREKWGYRHFDEHLDRFSAHFARVLDYFRSKQGTGPSLVWAIVAYVNHLPCSDAMDPVRQLDDILVIWSTIDLAGGKSRARQARINVTFPIPDDAGWLDVAVAPFRDSNGQPVWRLELTANAKIGGSSMEKMREALGAAHRFLVHAFVNLTTEQAHRLWGKRAVAQGEVR